MYKLLFGVELSDYHSCMKRAASLSSAINDSNAINWCQFFWELASNVRRQTLERVSGALDVTHLCCHH